MTKLALLASVAVLALTMAVAATTASASTVGGLIPPGLVFSNSDWNGWGSHHCNNVASVDYYNPASDHFIGATGSTPGTSWYTISPDLALDGTGGGDCGVTVLAATGFVNLLGAVSNPTCGSPRNPSPCDESGFYVEVLPANDTAGPVSVGQKGNLP
jgi:hypothetical protein